MKVAEKFDAFPFKRYGTVDGEVIDVSRDIYKGESRQTCAWVSERESDFAILRQNAPSAPLTP